MLYGMVGYVEGILIFSTANENVLITVATQSNTWVCGRSLAGNEDLNPSGVVDICLLCFFCADR
jgi:hypothetical protein